jgi:hypothetical protein
MSRKIVFLGLLCGGDLCSDPDGSSLVPHHGAGGMVTIMV